MTADNFFTITNRNTPIIVFALHDGHGIEDSLRDYLLLDEQACAREEDPYTGYMISDLPVTTVIVHSSRFQLDLNRAKDKSIYKKPEDAWGLNVWKNLPDSSVQELHKKYDIFYSAIAHLIEEAITAHGYFFILDVHSYNHKRDNSFEEAPVDTHPEINLGTAYNKTKWKNTCDRFAEFLSKEKILDHAIDARQNIIFKGGGFAQWVIENYGAQGAVFSIEFKKTFMDEWTGIANIPHINELKKLLALSVSFLYKERKQEKEDVKQ
ncbi:N-formylglutamate amidohydrolase [Niabella ginsengisoli]|uniref:N-formylglutamate amidohydrolase n=1 Tax=Niabella ginsengisoli TaxID=522298 RepID=A0ABS9SMH3_9BACT|nr:N-formylglutamate amidohydrolase [Niabella ginsengisoli]MCH5599359.1 N-formylglutamate amidohydrolase [Niabella ginsengisoli]